MKLLLTAVLFLMSSLAVAASQVSQETCEAGALIVYAVAGDRDRGLTPDQVMESIADHRGTVAYEIVHAAVVAVYSPNALNDTPVELGNAFKAFCLGTLDEPEYY